jgi:hypothetical protein
MRLTLEFASRYIQFESGRFVDAEPEADETEAAEVLHVPMGFTAIAPEEGIDDAEECEEPEAFDCA